MAASPIPLRHVVALTSTSVAGSLAAVLATGDGWMDRRVAQDAGRLMLDGHLDVYVRAAAAQMGPLALGVAGALPTGLFIAVVCAALYPFVLGLYAATEVAARPQDLVVALALGLTWWRFAITGHVDDVVVLFGVLLLLLGNRRGRPGLAGAGLALGLLGKPTAILLLPLVWAVSPTAAVAGVVAAAAVYAPFVLVDVGGFLRAGRGIVLVWPWSLPRLLGASSWSPFPAWVRPVQLGLGWVVGWWWVRRWSIEGAVLAVLTLRSALEPGTFPLYWQSILAVAACVDLRERRRVPVLTLIALAGFLVTFDYAAGPVTGPLRLVLHGVLLGWLVVVERRRAIRLISGLERDQVAA